MPRTPTLLLVALLIALPLLASAPPAGRAAPAGDGSWRTARIWDDGNAEYCVYDVSWPRYGHVRQGQATLVLVKEPWAPDLEVKADEPRGDGFDVLKLNHIRDFGTGVYTYHQMASAFLRRDSGTLRKLAVMSSEACGLTTALLTRNRLVTDSYFDGQGHRETAYPQGALPQDALPALLRDHVVGEHPASLLIFPTLMSGKLPGLEASTWKLSRQDAVTLKVPAGSFEGLTLRLEQEGRWQTWSFEKAAPHRLLRHEDSRGVVYALARGERLPYWRLNGPEDRAWLPARQR